MINKKNGVESVKDSAAVAASDLMAVPVTPDVKRGGTGEFHLVYGKKDLSGKVARMEKKKDDRVINKGEIVKDPETGLDVYLIRVHRNKRVWYGKGVINGVTSQVAEVSEEAVS